MNSKRILLLQLQELLFLLLPAPRLLRHTKAHPIHRSGSYPVVGDGQVYAGAGYCLH